MNVQASNYVHAKCYMPPIEIKHGYKGDLWSNHEINIKNETGHIETYHIVYYNEVTGLSGAPAQEFDVTLVNDQIYNDSRKFGTKVKYNQKGRYDTKAITYAIRKSDNNQMDYCESHNVLTIS